jgi:hypothetical protein
MTQGSGIMTQQTRGDNVSPEKEVGSLQEIARKAASEWFGTGYEDSSPEFLEIIVRALQSVAQPLEEKINNLETKLRLSGGRESEETGNERLPSPELTA